MARKSKLNAGVIGLGIIGSRIAANLRKEGFQVYVWNRTPKPAPNFLASPAEVAAICDIVQIVVADSVALFAIIEALGGVLSARHTVICSATVGAGATTEAARLVEAKGAKFLDAPFTGSKMAAEKGELVYYIGGSDQAFQIAEPVLEATSKAIVRIGAVGDAATVKIATNMLAAVTVQTLAEACALLAKSGIDPAALQKVLEHHGARSALTDMKLPNIISGDHETHFSVKHMFKDVQLAIQAANRFDIDIPATTATAGALYSGINQGWADLDYTAIAKFYEEEKVELPPAIAPEKTEIKSPEATTAVDVAPAPATPVEKVESPVLPIQAITPAVEKITDTSSPPATPPALPVEKQEEPTAENPPAAVDEKPAAKSGEIIPEPAITPPPKSKRPLPPIKPQKTTSHWFGVGRKK